MNTYADAWAERQRRRWMRPDAQCFMRPDAARFMTPEAARLLLPDVASESARSDERKARERASA